MSARLDRMEREMEYLENKFPYQSDIEMEEALLEQQIKAAELDMLKNKAKIKVEKGRKFLFTVKHTPAESNTVVVNLGAGTLLMNTVFVCLVE